MYQLKYATSPLVRNSSSFLLTRNVLVGEVEKYLPLAVGDQFTHNNKQNRVLKYVLNIVIVFSVLSFLAFFAPRVIYAVFTPETISLSGQFQKTARGGSLNEGTKKLEKKLPPVNENLPKESWLEIPLIGVRGMLHETEDEQEALNEGIWLDPKYGKPDADSDYPVVIAAHRYGWKWWWKDDYWQYNSFYKLPETEPGDIIEITYGQRKFVYEIYKATEGTAVEDLEADLILYTCKHLNSSVRHFRYARQIEL